MGPHSVAPTEPRTNNIGNTIDLILKSLEELDSVITKLDRNTSVFRLPEVPTPDGPSQSLQAMPRSSMAETLSGILDRLSLRISRINTIAQQIDCTIES